ncbi:NfeD family protein [Amycolatopsis aidingensis]|uniref:NfeD family protein n=1 Tax=Amycolatopsis aidingensis TaxID=2842453 RepID=UPI001C0D1DA4|nr:NfeD family protein [Amycolatopsis aidingensis]
MPVRRALGLALLSAGLLALASAAPHAAAPAQPPAAPQSVLSTRVEGPITQIVADHLAEGVRRAERSGHQAFLVTLETPGGASTAMREIVQSFLDAEVPVIGYVAPSGARAASAGALIMFSTHIAAMAPGTSIGAATPVSATGGDVGAKVVNEAAAFAESVARQRDRDVAFAGATVREGRAAPAREAARIGAVDLVAADRAELFGVLDGRTVRVAGGTETTLRTSGAPVVRHEMGTFTQLRQWLADPNLAFLFFALGGLALLYEVASPGIGLGGVLGAVLLILGFVALSVLPVNIAGIALLVLAIGLFVAEVLTPGIGIFAGGGALALVLSGLMLFEGPFRVDPPVLWPVAVVVGAGAVLAGRLALRARRRQPVSGENELIGRRTVVREVREEYGRAQVEGSWWNVRSPDRPLTEGQPVRVTGIRDLTLLVEPIPREES